MQGVDILFGILVLIFSIVMHEVAHGYAANSLGDPTARMQGRLTLNPLKHMDPFGSVLVPFLTFFAGGFIFGWAKPVPYNPYNLKGGKWSEAWVAAAGPLSNFLLAIIFSVILKVASGSGVENVALFEIGQLVIFINILLGIFNMIPIPPLDGSKVLFTVLPPSASPLIDFMNRYSLFFLLALVFFGWQFVVPVIAFLNNLLI